MLQQNNRSLFAKTAQKLNRSRTENSVKSKPFYEQSFQTLNVAHATNIKPGKRPSPFKFLKEGEGRNKLGVKLQS